MDTIYNNEPGCVTWFLAFTDVHRRHWWDRWIRPGFRHVHAFRQVEGGWLSINPRSDHCEIDIEPGYSHNARSYYVVTEDMDATVLKVTAKIPEGRLRSRWFVGPVTCVEFIKALLGIRAFFVLTPRQLYNYVRENRGTILEAKDTRTFSG